MNDVDPATARLHQPTDPDVGWRESLYLNLGDSGTGVGVWIYFWTFPHQDTHHVQIVLYRGVWPKPTLTKALRAATAPTLLTRGEEWMYTAHSRGSGPFGDLDDLRAGGLQVHLEGNRYEVAFDDGGETRFDGCFELLAPRWLYSEAPGGCPQWLAADRYHQAARGELRGRVGGRELVVRGVGDTDHSWGVRDHARMARADWDYWAWCSADGGEQLSLFRFIEPEHGTTLFGHRTSDGASAAIVAVDAAMLYDEQDASLGGRVVVRDELGREITATAAPSYAAVGYGDASRGWSEGYEAVTVWDVGGARVDGLYAHTRPAST
jgi:hypothetical protein